ncbi:hypothetical protein J6590_056174 [Homalodisca vitripennis]|nr:hypothetical protein J6590_056174 [Homalodisca vitripennis]
MIQAASLIRVKFGGWISCGPVPTIPGKFGATFASLAVGTPHSSSKLQLLQSSRTPVEDRPHISSQRYSSEST